MFKKGDLVRYYRQTIYHTYPYNTTGGIFRVEREYCVNTYFLSRGRKETHDVFNSNELQLLKKG